MDGGLETLVFSFLLNLKLLNDLVVLSKLTCDQALFSFRVKHSGGTNARDYKSDAKIRPDHRLSRNIHKEK